MLENFYQKLKQNTDDAEHQFELYGALTVFGYIFFHFYNIYFYISPLYESLSVRLIAAFLALGLAFYRFWPSYIKSALPIFWHITLLYNLPFFFTFMFLMNEGIAAWQLNMFVAFIVLIILADWKTALVLSILGVSGGYYLAISLNPHLFLPEGILALITGYFTILIYIMAFSYKKDKVLKDRAKSLKDQAAAIAHEMRTPLSIVSISSQVMNDKLTPIREHFQKTDPQKNFEKDLSLLMDSASKLDKIARRSQKLINVLLMNLRHDLENMPTNKLSMKQVITQALKDFGYQTHEEEKIHLDVKSDFTFHGNEEVAMHVFFNLLKNSLYFIQAANKGKIYITVSAEGDYHQVIFKDTGPGIQKTRLPNVFKPFYSKRPHGTGVGLSFCKRAVEGMGGTIAVTSEFGKYTTFIIRLPK